MLADITMRSVTQTNQPLRTAVVNPAASAVVGAACERRRRTTTLVATLAASQASLLSSLSAVSTLRVPPLSTVDRRIGPYVLEAKIGEGGMGVVYRAKHADSDHEVALKLQSVTDDAGALFQRESLALQRLSHPNVVAGLDHGVTCDNRHYLAMELLSGVTLTELIEQQGAQPAERVVQVLLQVATGLAEVHRQGLVHRDIKPSNLMLCHPSAADQSQASDLLKILDFGLVREVGPGAPSFSDDEPTVVGTPLYLAPESIFSPHEIDHRVDIYALGAVGYYLLTGKHVFCTSDAYSLCRQHLSTPPPPLAERGAVHCPPRLERIILRCLAKLPAERFPDMQSLCAALQQI